MTEPRTYSVAGFRFGLEAEPSLFGRMQNLQPFCLHNGAASEDEELLFSIHTVPAPFESGDSEKATYSACSGDVRPRTDIYAGPDSWRFQFRSVTERPVAAELVSDKSFRHGQLYLSGVSDRFGLNMALKLMFTFATAFSGALETHASVVVNDGKGYLFLGFSGTGKSTHSRLWMESLPGTELLNDDYPVLRLMPDGSVRVFGSPWSGQTPCYKQENAPVGAIVWLKQGPENRIQQLSAVDAYAALMSSTSAFRPMKKLADGWHKTLEAISTTIPFYVLECLPDKSAAELCYHTVHSKTNI